MYIKDHYKVLRKEVGTLTIKRENIKNELFCLIHRAMIGEHPIKLSSNLKNDLEIDSMMMFRLLVDCEESFNIKFDPSVDDFNNIFQTTASLLLAIKRKIDGD